MGKPKIYLETTLFNFYFDTDRDAHADTVTLFTEIAEGKYEAFTSEAVTDELKDAPAEKRDKMLALLDEYPIAMLTVNDVANALADSYVTEGIIPAKYRTDGVHIAVAAVNGLDIVASVNFKHIVRIQTTRRANAINVYKGFRAVVIASPMQIVENSAPNPVEDEIDRIREKIYEETKDMTPAQRVEYTHEKSESFVKEMGYRWDVINPQGHMRLVKTQPDTPQDDEECYRITTSQP